MSHTHENGNGDTIANALYTSLTTGISVPVAPDFSDSKYSFTVEENDPLYDLPVGVDIETVTAGCLDGNGSFDTMMKAIDAHLEREFRGSRITGDQYAKVYSEVMQGVLSNATSFALQKDTSKWQAITAQMQARIAQIEATKALVGLEREKVEAAKAVFEMQNSGAQYALTKMKLSTEDATHCNIRSENAIKDYQLNYILPVERAIKDYERMAVLPSQVAMNRVQSDRILPAEASIAEYNNRVMQPIEADIQKLQRDRVIVVGAEIEEFRRDNLLPIELAKEQHLLNKRMPSETRLIDEQVEAQYAQTQDTRTDGLTPISGILKLQKDNLEVDFDTKTYVLGNQLPKQVDLVQEQIELTSEQRESERAKTLDVRSDGQNIEGSVGKQKDLYDQQIDSFVKDAQHKTAKMYLDAWITQKTLDEGLVAPSQLTNNNIDAVMAGVRGNNSL